jgi:hypothetical protein
MGRLAYFFNLLRLACAVDQHYHVTNACCWPDVDYRIDKGENRHIHDAAAGTATEIMNVAAEDAHDDHGSSRTVRLRPCTRRSTYKEHSSVMAESDLTGGTSAARYAPQDLTYSVHHHSTDW